MLGWSPNGAYLKLSYSPTHVTVSNSYFHGWTMATSASSDTHYMIGGSGGGNTGNVYSGNVFDGSDSSLGAVCNSSSCVGNPGNGGTPLPAGPLRQSVTTCIGISSAMCRMESSAEISLLFTTIYSSTSSNRSNNGPHGNVVESLGGYSGETAYFYNNVTRNVNEGVN